jgi:hypothetical protein
MCRAVLCCASDDILKPAGAARWPQIEAATDAVDGRGALVELVMSRESLSLGVRIDPGR